MNMPGAAPSLEGSFRFEVDRGSVESGGSAQLLVHSPFLKTAVEFIAFHQHGKELSPVNVIQLGEAQYELHFPTEPGEVTATLSGHLEKQEFIWKVEMGGPEAQVSLCFPFLAELTLGDSSQQVDFFSLKDRQGRPILRHRDADAPYGVTNGQQSLILIQNGELVKRGYSSTRLIQPPGLEITLSPESRVIYQGKILLTSGGWREAFDQIRAHLRSQIDLSEYQRADLDWYSDQFVQHFTFLYGREILDLDQGEFKLDRFLDEGERDFGGYDGFLIWGVYPRIGIDERTQWDFYDDLPGGREGLKRISVRARERGVRFFVPYKPWDVSAEHHGVPKPPHAEELAQLIVDTQADGVFLDTMDMITPEFRQAIDQRKPGVVFCSEGRTMGKALEIVTGCWEQSLHRDFNQGNWSAAPESMPMIDLWRFALPEHRLFVINRHAMGDDRIRIIQRGFFNGMGWVVWQDIFGLVLPYSPAEAALLKKCRTIFRENLEAVNSSDPTPLVQTDREGLFANEFPAANKRMWTLFNENESPVSGSILGVRPREDFHFVDVWNQKEVAINENSDLTLEMGPQQVGCVVEYPRLLERSGADIRIRGGNPAEDWQIAVEYGGDLRLYPVKKDTLLYQVRSSERANIKLMQGRQVLDQLCMDEGI